MASTPGPSGPPPAAEDTSQSWTEPPWCGWIESTGDALLILEAARRGIIPRVTRRLVDAERRMISSGSVFVFDEDESGIKRWTDGFYWSPSRILGNFLLYRETDKKANLRSNQRKQPPPISTPGSLLVDQDGLVRPHDSALSRPKNTEATSVERARERVLVGSLTNDAKFKSAGMMKKTFSVTIGGVAQHLISYYKVEDVEQGRLRTPSSLPELAALEISPEYLDKTHFRVPPRIEYDTDGQPRYRGEADEPGSPSYGYASLPPESADIASKPSKRTKQRYEPYSENTIPKSRRKSRANPPANHGPSDEDPVMQARTAPPANYPPLQPYGSASPTTAYFPVSQTYPSYGSYQGGPGSPTMSEPPPTPDTSTYSQQHGHHPHAMYSPQQYHASPTHHTPSFYQYPINGGWRPSDGAMGPDSRPSDATEGHQVHATAA